MHLLPLSLVPHNLIILIIDPVVIPGVDHEFIVDGFLVLSAKWVASSVRIKAKAEKRLSHIPCSLAIPPTTFISRIIDRCGRCLSRSRSWSASRWSREIQPCLSFATTPCGERVVEIRKEGFLRQAGSTGSSNGSRKLFSEYLICRCNSTRRG